jgi:hypothetical protein
MGKLLLRISEQTSAGKISWQESARTNEYEVSFPESSIGVGVDKDGDRYIALYDDVGNQIELLGTWGSTPHEQQKIIHDLFDTARRQALDIDGKIRKILDRLK